MSDTGTADEPHKPRRGVDTGLHYSFVNGRFVLGECQIDPLLLVSHLLSVANGLLKGLLDTCRVGESL